MFSWTNKENYPLVIPVTLSYLEHWISQEVTLPKLLQLCDFVTAIIIVKFHHNTPNTVKPAYVVTCIKGSPAFSSHISWVPLTPVQCK